jgi:pimeloyl-ACP methyl ester carboxylesterase
MREFPFNSLDGTKLIGWRNEGSGPRILLCNGMSSPANAWPSLLNPDCGFDVASWYMRGFFGSDRPGNLPDGMTVPAQSLDAIGLMDHLGWDRTIFLGWSFGVNMAVEVARSHPERVAGLVAVAGVPGGTFHALLGRNPIPPEVRKRLGVLGAHGLESQSFGINTIVNNLTTMGYSAAAEVLQRGGFFGPLAKHEELTAVVESYLKNDFAWFFRSVRIMAEHDPLDVTGLELPAEVLVGLQDTFTDPRLVEQFGRDLPQADLMLLKASHFVPLEAPEEVNAALARVVKRVALADRLAAEATSGQAEQLTESADPEQQQ